VGGYKHLEGTFPLHIQKKIAIPKMEIGEWRKW
jgi:hypothetical protein